jgi:hypothetical protein
VEVQYAIFCGDIRFPTQPKEPVVLVKPLASLEFQGAEVVRMNMPLFVTFLNGDVKSRHNLDVKITSSSGQVLTTRDFKFEWRGNSPVQGERFIVDLPELHTSDTLTFSLVLDGEQQFKMKVPIKITS